jgi:quinoprotein glucose dehydrogenase
MADASSGSIWSRPFVYATLLILIGLYLLVGGVWLAALGGSWYYLITGLVVIASGVLLWMRRRWGSWLYGLMLACTVIWALIEVGWSPWGLAARILAPAVLGLWLLTPWVQRRLDGRGLTRLGGPRPGHATAAAASLALLVAGGLLAGTHPWARASAAEAPPAAPAPAGAARPSLPGDWVNYGNTLAGSRYSPLSQINTSDVGRLKLAWSFRTGDLPRPGEKAPREFTDEVTPIKVGDALYLCTPHNQVISLDAETGAVRWRFDPHVNSAQVFVIACRGVSYYARPGASGPCARRIVAATTDARLLELDADTGRLCPGFGAGGSVDLTRGMGLVVPGFSYQTSAPTVAGDRIIVGGWIIDNVTANEPSGVVRAFDASTGQLSWAWDMGAPDRTGAPPPGQQYTRNTPNAWATYAADPSLNLVYVPTGNSPPDWWGGRRRPFDDRYSSSIVALDLDTGRPRWSFQTTHHDTWDYDVPAQPVLVDLPTASGTIPALAQATKRGEIFVLDRRNGHPVFPVTERPVPGGGPAGDRLSPTQPFSAISLLPPRLREADMWGVTPLDQLVCRIRFRQSRYEGIFTPWTLDRPDIEYPGSLGVVDWGGVAIDEARKLLIANTSAVPYRNELLRRSEAPPPAQGVRLQTPPPGQPQADYAWSPMIGTPYSAHVAPFMGPLKVPCNQPPWGFLRAIDLKTGKQVWKRPIGSTRDSGPYGIALPFAIPMGVPNIGGSIVTAGGLIFNGATLDQYLRAYDEATGRKLWQARLPAGGQATPMTYISPRSGRQFVVIAAGGHQGLSTRTGDYILAYALPRAG